MLDLFLFPDTWITGLYEAHTWIILGAMVGGVAIAAVIERWWE